MKSRLGNEKHSVKANFRVGLSLAGRCYREKHRGFQPFFSKQYQSDRKSENSFLKNISKRIKLVCGFDSLDKKYIAACQNLLVRP
jgi:hypothetical protein